MNPGLKGLMNVKVTKMIEFPAPSPCFLWASWRPIKFELWGSPAGMQWSQGSRKGGEGWAKAGMGGPLKTILYFSMKLGPPTRPCGTLPTMLYCPEAVK